MSDSPATTPSLRLFLSADLAGSTAFKQKRAPEEWHQFFGEFYRQLPSLVERQQETFGVTPAFWKPIGDEIVFQLALKSLRDVGQALQAFRAAVFAYRGSILESPGDLDLKCAAWTAGFPVGNMAVQLPNSQWDYIGPGMDTGFRLVKEASPRRMLLSVELAWLLTHPAQSEALQLHLGAPMHLKGVAKGRMYPCLWLDNFTDDTEHGGCQELELSEDRLRGISYPIAPAADTHNYCAAWIASAGTPFIPPFIQGDEAIGTQPKGYAEQLDRILSPTQGAEDMQDEPSAEDGSASAEEIISSLESLGKKSAG